MSVQRISQARRALIACAVVLGVGFGWTRVLVARVEGAHAPSGAFVDVDGHRVHYLERGHGVPIVLLHGAYGGVEDWTASIFDAVAGRGRALAIDRPGHGHSETWHGAPLTPPAQARWLHAVLERLDVRRPVIVGFSWSGGVAASYALQYPDETAAVMTVNGALYDWDAITSTTDALLGLPVLGPVFAHTVAVPLAQSFRRSAVARAFEPALIPTSFERSALDLEMRPESLLVNAAEMRALKPALRLLSPHYAEIRVPLTIVTGLGDRITGPHFHSYRLHEVVPGSTLVPVAGAGHQIAYTHPVEVLRALDDLLARTPGGGAR